LGSEDPAKSFQPDTGKIEVYRSAGGNGVRLDGTFKILVAYSPFSNPAPRLLPIQPDYEYCN
jgi:pyruvate carboxylase